MKSLIRAQIGRLLMHARLLERINRNAFYIVAFHRVNDLMQDPLTCSTRDFEAYCRFFATHFNVVPLSMQLDWLQGGGPLAGSLAITFDDGYRDNYEIALPIMQQFGLTATIFIVSGFIGTGTVAWWDAGKAHVPPWMTWDQVAGLAASGFSVGCHTHLHSDLGKLDAGRTRQELERFKDVLRRHTGLSADLFAYPYGRTSNVTAENTQAVRDAGFRCCLSCHGGVNAVGGDPFSLARVPVGPWFHSPYDLGYEMAVG
jgi:peptidoglycan/xylan/chitin deacetylase (PgdA/CDA1 family)